MPVDVGYGVPENYNYINMYNSSFSPSTVHVKNTALQKFFKRYLFQKAVGVFKWTLPKTWNPFYFKYVLFAWGFIGVVETDKFGVICQAGAPYGYDIYYQPTNLIITNPLLKGSLNPRIGQECSVIKLQPDWGGIMDLVNYYADMMALAAETFSVNMMNSHLSYIFPADKQNIAESFKKMFDRVSSGEPAVVIDKALFKEDGSASWEPFTQNIGQNYIADRVISDLRKLEAEFDTKIGIPNANTDKRERLISSEVEANNTETEILVDTWIENLRQGILQTQELFGLPDLAVELRYPTPEGGTDNGTGSEDKPARPGELDG